MDVGEDRQKKSLWLWSGFPIMIRHIKVGTDGKVEIPYLPQWEVLCKATYSGFVLGGITGFLHQQIFAEAKSALLKKSLSSALVNGSRCAIISPLYVTVEQSLIAARGEVGPLNSFLSGALVGSVVALSSPTRHPAAVCISAFLTGSATAVISTSLGKLVAPTFANSPVPS